jgi:hypothetical protein
MGVLNLLSALNRPEIDTTKHNHEYIHGTMHSNLFSKYCFGLNYWNVARTVYNFDIRVDD